MNRYNLLPTQSIEEMRQKLMQHHKRPVYIAACGYVHGTHYKRPGETRYTSMGRLEFFLSLWDDRGLCVKREGDLYYYDLVPAKTLHLVVPVTPADMKNDDKSRFLFGCDFFKVIGLPADLNHRDTIFFDRNDRDVPEELERFVVPYRRRAGANEKRPGIQFVKSVPIDAPLELRKKWHLGIEGADFRTLQPPGFYSGVDYTIDVGTNLLAIADLNPGPCIACHGESNSRKHLGIAYKHGIRNTVCLLCFNKAVPEWEALMKEAQPVAELVSDGRGCREDL
jgi:hypothetical protein